MTVGRERIIFGFRKVNNCPIVLAWGPQPPPAIRVASLWFVRRANDSWQSRLEERRAGGYIGNIPILMRVLIACDSFKGTLSAIEACDALARGISSAWPGVRTSLCPLSDGGEGTVALLARSLGMGVESVKVTGPMGVKIDAEIAWCDGSVFRCIGAQPGALVAAIEVASCSGLTLVPLVRRNPLQTTSYGFGEAILHAVKNGANWIVLGLGGSATVDGGLGCLQALGAKLRGVAGMAQGSSLQAIAGIDLSEVRQNMAGVRLVVANDVQNPLLGARGAARAFGPQKGATPEMVEVLESGMEHYARLLVEGATPDARLLAQRATQSSNFVAAVDQTSAGAAGGLGFAPGVALRAESRFVAAVDQTSAGAAGGLGFALGVALRAESFRGIELLLNVTGFDERLKLADLVITGEGRLDVSSFEGKVVSGVVERSRRRGVPVWVVAGSSDLPREHWARHGLSRVYCLTDIAQDETVAQAHAAAILAELPKQFDWS